MPRTPDSAIRMTFDGSPGAMRAKQSRSTSSVLQVARVDADDAWRRPAARGRPPPRCAPRPAPSCPATRCDPASTPAPAAPAPRRSAAACRRRARGPRGSGTGPTMKSLRSTGIDTAARTASRSSSDAVEAALLGQHADDPRAAVLVGAASSAGSAIDASSPARRAGPLHLGDDADAGLAQRRHHIQWRRRAFGRRLDLGDAHDRFTSGNVGADSLDDGVEHGCRTHAVGSSPRPPPDY